MNYYYYYQREWLRWHRIRRLQGHLTISDSVTVQTDISKVVWRVQLSRMQGGFWRPPMVAYCRLGHSLPEESAARKTQDNYSPLQAQRELPAGISSRQIELRLQELSRCANLPIVYSLYVYTRKLWEKPGAKSKS